jgi:HEPN domain-containing protein
MNKEEHVRYWQKSARHDLDSAEAMFDAGRFDGCLFVGHLSLEKLLMAIFVHRNESELPPRIHNLVRLAELSGIDLDDHQKFLLDTITDFNIQTRYPDYKLDFYKQCTREYTDRQLSIIKEFYQWLDSLLK